MDVEQLALDTGGAVVQATATNLIVENVLASSASQAIINNAVQSAVSDAIARGASDAVALKAGEVAASVAGEQIATEALSAVIPFVGIAITAVKDLITTGSINVENLAIAGVSTAAGMAAGATAGSVIPGIGTIVGAVVGIALSFLVSDSPSDAEIADWKVSAREAINPSLMAEGISGEVSSQIAAVVASGDTTRAKQMMHDALSSSALGKIATMSGLSGLFDSAVALMNNRVERLGGAYVNDRGELSIEDHIDTGNANLDKLTNDYIDLKNKLKHCYTIKDNDCVSEVSQEIRGARNGLILVATNKFNDEIVDLNKQIHKLEVQLAQAKSEKEKAEIQARMAALSARRDSVRDARDQYQDIARACPPGTHWHFVDHYCIEISRTKAHCASGGGTWNGKCVCNAKPDGWWMGDHCEYGFNEQQKEQNSLNDAADGCRHRIGNWHWNGSACVEVSQAQAGETACSKKGTNWVWKNGYCSYEGGGEN